MYPGIPGLRPLTLSSTDNKIVARALQRSLAGIAEDIVHPTQRGVMRGRQIVDNVFEAEGTIMEYAVLGATFIGMLLLDIEAAFPSAGWLWIAFS